MEIATAITKHTKCNPEGFFRTPAGSKNSKMTKKNATKHQRCSPPGLFRTPAGKVSTKTMTRKNVTKEQRENAEVAND